MIIRVMLYHRIVASLFCAIDDGNANAVLLWFTVIDQWSSYIRYPLFYAGYMCDRSTINSRTLGMNGESIYQLIRNHLGLNGGVKSSDSITSRRKLTSSSHITLRHKRDDTQTF